MGKDYGSGSLMPLFASILTRNYLDTGKPSSYTRPILEQVLAASGKVSGIRLFAKPSFASRQISAGEG
jgi:hypothetical protein